MNAEGEVLLNLSLEAPQTARTEADFDFAGYLEAITVRELRLTLEEIRAGSRRHESMDQLTRQVAGLYAERFLLELVQNAYDGAGPSGSAHIVIRLDYRAGPHGTLYVANGGRGFTPENVDAITNPALSSKHPGQDLGHKGLGFRSVATISDDPQIYSMSGTETKTRFDGFCFRFARPEDECAVLRRLDGGNEAHLALGKTHRMQLPVPSATSQMRSQPLLQRDSPRLSVFRSRTRTPRRKQMRSFSLS
jgi:hypothetical protein